MKGTPNGFLLSFNIVDMEKKVLLFSGGFDSMLQEWLLKPDVLLYVDMKTSYSQREIEALDLLPQSYKDRLIIKECPIGEYERENKYLPYRNLILGTIGMQYGQHVYFGFNVFDDAPDKDRVYMDKVNSLFRHLNKNCIGDMGWENNRFGFYAPFQKYSKTDLVRKCLESGMSGELIKHIRSCYSGTSEIGCGVCRVCFNKAVALLNNDLYEDCLFDKPITEEDFDYTYQLIKEEPDAYPKKYIYEVNKARAKLRQVKK